MLCVVAVGQLPPPVSGLSYITQETIAAARGGATEVVVNNIAARNGAAGLRKHLSRMGATALACLSLARQAKSQSRHRGDRICYAACEGGLGLVYILTVVTWARLCGYRMLLHHHSFAYITRPSALINAILAAGGKRLVHVFLGKDMERGFRERYVGRGIEGIVMSNAAFVPPCAGSGTMADGPLVLGHISNLTKEKGLHIFLDLLRAAVAAGLPVRAILAGPAAKPADRALIERAREDLGGYFEYRGPLYGGEKDAFYRDIDVFVFPTQYIHEAQPTVLFEAQAAGCQVVSFDRGCILEQVQQDGLVMPQDSDFVSVCLDWLRANGGAVRSERTEVCARYAARHTSARQIAKTLFTAAFDSDRDDSLAATR